MSSDEHGYRYSFRATQQRAQEQEYRSRMDRFGLDARARQYADELAARKPVDEMTVEEVRQAQVAQWAQVMTDLADCRRVHDPTRAAWLARLEDLPLRGPESVQAARRLRREMEDYDDGELITDGVRLGLMQLEDLGERLIALSKGTGR
jgi:hypothetical protein